MSLDGYKDELKPVFKSTPTQFQTIIFASGDKQNVGDFVGDMSEIKLTERQKKNIEFDKRVANNNRQTNVGDFVGESSNYRT